MSFRLSLRVWVFVVAGVIGVAMLANWLLVADVEAGKLAQADVADRVLSVEGALLPLPVVPQYPAAKVALGRALFHDNRLSRDNTIACASCHNLAKGGDDGRPVSIGVAGAQGSINAPTVLNAALNFMQFWDGRAASLEEQVAGPVSNPVEMASSWPDVIVKLGADAATRRQFAEVYGDGITAANIADAIATFERTLISGNTPFDRYLRGDKTAISERAQEGYRRFLTLGCASCHQGANVGGNMFQKFGVMGDYLGSIERRRPLTDADLGRFNVTRRDDDRQVFKVPSLRNVALTAPYFHDGSATSLDVAVKVMGQYQLGRQLSPDEIDSLVSFLETLTGDVMAVAGQ